MQTENLHNDSIRTYSGLYMNVFDPKPEMICIEDIAHALAHQCRFGGHTKRFYSVAQHSVSCALMVSPTYQLQALMHDASEAYLLDIPSPIKKHLIGYKELEDRMMEVIAEKFGFEFPLSEPTHYVDGYMLHEEWMRIILDEPTESGAGMKCLRPEEAEELFLSTFLLLTGKEVTNA